MLRYDYEVLSAEAISKNKHNVALMVPTRPPENSNLVEYYNKVSEDFAVKYHCVIVEVTEVRLNPFRESALVFLTVTTKKSKLKKFYRGNTYYR